MLVAEKTHHINTYIYGQGADYILEILQKNIPDLQVVTEDEPDDDEVLSDVSQSDWYLEMQKEMTPGTKLRIRRENRNLTQAELSDKTGIAIPNISLMEAGKRSIGLRTAKKLAVALECDVDDFV